MYLTRKRGANRLMTAVHLFEDRMCSNAGDVEAIIPNLLFLAGPGFDRCVMNDQTPPSDVTGLLQAWSAGDRSALDELMPVVYAELHRLARARLRGERADHTLQATALVNEAYVRLVDQTRVRWQNRAQFFGTAAQLMRRILVDHAREHRSAKRGGGATRVELDEALGSAHQRDVDLLALDAALERLERLDPRQSRLVVLRFFGGLTIDEVAEVLEISPATAKREWVTARIWLRRELDGRPGIAESNDP